MHVTLLSRISVALLFLFLVFSTSTARPGAARNSWRGITPLRSSAADVAQAIGIEPDTPDAQVGGPYQVEGGEVTFSYLTPSLAKIYRAPRHMVGKVFTIYFKPSQPIPQAELKLTRDFKRCVEEFGKSQYYLVSDAGIAYQFPRNSDQVDTIIYQPTRAEIRRLAVNAECVF
ncbi:MAG TPA: hypothetical protein VNO70_01715 [Blastocatellia bacterium]|nr:hypothetical protein [Blastocatellia bacterium]